MKDNKENKELLFKDLSARLPYGVIVDYKEGEYDFQHWKISTLHAPAYSQSGNLISTDSDGWIEYEEYKGCGMSTGSRPLHIEITLPFLRPMSSMTEEEDNERKQLGILCTIKENGSLERIFDGFGNESVDTQLKALDWLNAHHFDYRDLIEKGLALEAPKGMYT